MGPAVQFACCEGLATTLHMVGVGVSLCGQPMFASVPLVGRVEDRQFVLGEGPLIDAFQRQVVVETPDVDDRAAHGWLGLDLAAEGVGATFAFPLLVSDACLGAMTVYRRQAAPLSDAQRVLLQLGADATALETAGLLVEQRAVRHRDPALARVNDLHRAIGVVMSQLSIGATEATTRLRAHAFQSDRTAEHVVSQLLSHALELTDDRTSSAHELSLQKPSDWSGLGAVD